MKILQFAFDSREESDYLPHNYTHNCVVYTGTHDNDTVMGWYDTLKGADKKLCDDYLRLKNADGEPIPREQLPWEFVRAAMSSVADLAIIPMQDYLGLDRRPASTFLPHWASTGSGEWGTEILQRSLQDGSAV